MKGMGKGRKQRVEKRIGERKNEERILFFICELLRGARASLGRVLEGTISCGSMREERERRVFS